MRALCLILLLTLSVAHCGKDEVSSLLADFPGGPVYLIDAESGSSDPSYSADGSEILYIYSSNIWTCDPSGGNNAQRSNINMQIISPNRHPDNPNQVSLIYSNRSDDFHLATMELDGTPTDIYNTENRIMSSSWTRDGNYVLFLEPDKAKGVFKVPVSGGDAELIPNEAGWLRVSECKGSFNSDTILYSSYVDGKGRIYQIDPSGGVPTEILSYGADITGFAESRDGSKMAFTIPDPNAYTNILMITNLPGGTAKQAMQSHRNKIFHTNWSPDNKSLVFEVYNSVLRGTAESLLYRMDIKDGFPG
ncbi:TolB family protein [candidate division KSB1 bacterium]